MVGIFVVLAKGVFLEKDMTAILVTIMIITFIAMVVSFRGKLEKELIYQNSKNSAVNQGNLAVFSTYTDPKNPSIKYIPASMTANNVDRFTARYHNVGISRLMAANSFKVTVVFTIYAALIREGIIMPEAEKIFGKFIPTTTKSDKELADMAKQLSTAKQRLSSLKENQEAINTEKRAYAVADQKAKADADA